MTVAYLFPGQGSQYVGMGRELAARSGRARAFFDEADALFGFSLSDLTFSGPEEKLTDTMYQQPAIFVASLANYQAMKDDGWPDAHFFAGHSLGEFSALVAAGSLSFSDGLRLVRKRGELMKKAGEHAPGAMAAVLALPVEEVVSICTQATEETGLLVQVANDNCPGQSVISGYEAALLRAVELAEHRGARRVIRLPISIAAHTPLMGSVAAEFAEAVDATPLRAPEVPVIANVSAQPLTAVDAIRTELKTQLTSPVAWADAMRTLMAQGVDEYIEVGPNDVLLGLVKRVDRRAKRLAFDKGPEAANEADRA